MGDETRNPKIEGANPESVDVDMPEQGEPETRDRSRMAEPSPPERVIPRRGKRRPGQVNPPLSPKDLDAESDHDAA